MFFCVFMQVIFSDSVAQESADVVVVVAFEQECEFFKNKMQELAKNEMPDVIFQDCLKMKYKGAKKYDLIVADKLVEFLFVSAGEKDKANRASLEKLGGAVHDLIKAKNAKVCVYNDIENKGTEAKLAAAYFSSGMMLKSWNFEKYKSVKTEQKIDSVFCQTCFVKENQNEMQKMKNVAGGVHFVRELVSEPANVMTPEKMLEEAMGLKKHGVKVNFLTQKDMEKLGMNAILGVGNGSDSPSYVIAMEYQKDKTKDVVALVGKGLTFDSGGLCLKPALRMGEMKGDMAGAAVVMGTLKALAESEALVNVVGVVGVTENMISGSAQRPGDVVVSMSGKTIEVDNTDAEGRLVLADVLCYANQKYAPKTVIDVATLTGAIQVALGSEFAGLFSNSDHLAELLEKSGNIVGEKLWRMPLHDSFEEDIKSCIADLKNVGSGNGAGSITAAMFLQHFIPKSVEWAHLDIAATEWEKAGRSLAQKGASGFGVRLLVDFVLRRC